MRGRGKKERERGRERKRERGERGEGRGDKTIGRARPLARSTTIKTRPEALGPGESFVFWVKCTTGMHA